MPTKSSVTKTRERYTIPRVKMVLSKVVAEEAHKQTCSPRCSEAAAEDSREDHRRARAFSMLSRLHSRRSIKEKHQN